MKLSLWTQATTLAFNLIMASLASPHLEEPQQCVGKHQIPIEDLHDFQVGKEMTEAIRMTNFDKLPVETVLENNDQTAVIKMKYEAKVPTINFGASAGLSTYRFSFLYFQSYENSTALLPFELHAVFYDTKFKEFQMALREKNMIVVLAFGLQLKHKTNTKYSYSAFNLKLKSVKSGLSEIVLDNRPLNVWLPAVLESYLMYEGYFPFYNCTAQVLWFDFETEIALEAEQVKDFEDLQTSSGQSLMKRHKSFVRPRGPLAVNIIMGSSSMGAIPFVDAYDDDYDGGFVPFGGGAKKSENTKTVSALFLFLKLLVMIR